MEQLSIDLRPRAYARVVGQEHARMLLQKMRAQSYFPRVIMLSGPPGVGKTTLARIWAAHVNCVQVDTTNLWEPCGTCANCQGIFAGSSNLVTEIEAAVRRKVEDVDAIRTLATFAVPFGARRVVIIDEFHAISNTGQESLLHVFESVSDTTFILTTTEPSSVLDPVLSRCFPINLAPISSTERARVVEQYLVELKIDFEPEVPSVVNLAARFGMRSTWQIVDKLRIEFGENKWLAGRAAGALGLPKGTDLESFFISCAKSYLAAAGDAMGLADAGVEWAQFVDCLLRVAEDSLAFLESGEFVVTAGESEEFLERRLLSRAQCLRLLDGVTELRHLDWRYGVPKIYAILAAPGPVEVTSAPTASAVRKPTTVELLSSDPVWIRINQNIGTRIVETYVDA